MPKKKAKPPEDIPAWFMTYSDVITLLMTFFILLLTFSTTEPERFEKVQTAVHSSAGATGIVGDPVDGLNKDAWVTRIRPPSSRIANRGAEMPPLTHAPVKATFGKGLKSLKSDERNHNLSTSHFFDVEISRLFDSDGNVSATGKQICKMLSDQLWALPFQASIQTANAENSPKLIKLLTYMFKEQRTRPGQVGMSILKNSDLKADRIRFVITRFEDKRL